MQTNKTENKEKNTMHGISLMICAMLVFASVGGAPIVDPQVDGSGSEEGPDLRTEPRWSLITSQPGIEEDNTPERWYDPCGQGTKIHTTSSSEVAPISGPSLSDILQLADLVTEVATSSKTLKDEFKNMRFVDNQVITALEQTDIPQYAEELLRIRSISASNYLNITDNVMMAFWSRMSLRKLSWAAAYLVLAQEEESVHERDSFKPRFSQAEEDVYRIMCKLLVVLENMQVNPGAPLTRDEAIPQEFKFPKNSDNQDMRDYLALRDYVRYLDIFANEISLIADSARS